MNKPAPPKRPPNKLAQIGAVVGTVVGVVGFNAVAPQYFPPRPGGGIDWMQVLWAGRVAGICAGLGAIIGAAISAASGGSKPPEQG